MAVLHSLGESYAVARIAQSAPDFSLLPQLPSPSGLSSGIYDRNTRISCAPRAREVWFQKSPLATSAVTRGHSTKSRLLENGVGMLPGGYVESGRRIAVWDRINFLEVVQCKKRMSRR